MALIILCYKTSDENYNSILSETL